MIYNDEQLPNEDSIAKMQQGYARRVSILQNEDNGTNNGVNNGQNANNGQGINNGQNAGSNTNLGQSNGQNLGQNSELSAIAGSIDWETNTALLNSLSRTQNRCMRSFIRGLIPLNQQDRDEINGYYNQNGIRRNPSVINTNSGTFNQTLRDYIRNETELLDRIVELLYLETDADRRTSLNNIIRRRLDALDTLASFWSGTIFG